MEQKMLTVPGLAVRNLRHRRVRTMFLAALVLILCLVYGALYFGQRRTAA